MLREKAGTAGISSGGGIAPGMNGAGLALGSPPAVSSFPATGSGRFVGIQVGARSFVDEGVEKVLDIFQERADVNALFLATFTYGRGLAGRQVPGQPLPDHGVQQYDTIHGGSYTAVHPQFYTNSIIQNFRAPELGSFDILADVIPKAKARGMKSYCLFEEVYNPRLIENFEKIAEVDLYGRPGRSTCLNNPYARNFLCALVEDWFKSNEVDGLMWESERQGPFNNTIRADFGSLNSRSPIVCFCKYCRLKGQERGISVERACNGYQALDQWVRNAEATPRPNDGYFVTLWRLLAEYPEIGAWEKMWFDNQHEVYALLYGAIKSVNPRAQVGWHLMHLISMSPFYRAELDYSKLVPVSDFLKPSLYNNCGGPRLAQYVRNIHSTAFRDLTPADVLELHYEILGYQGEASLDQLSSSGLTADTVARETRRTVGDVPAGFPVYPGIDIDIPTPLGDKRTQPSDVKAAVLAAFNSGAAGVVLSRKYAEMKLSNLSGAGEALRELRYRSAG